jgi:hypothetical protein
MGGSYSFSSTNCVPPYRQKSLPDASIANKFFQQNHPAPQPAFRANSGVDERLAHFFFGREQVAFMTPLFDRLHRWHTGFGWGTAMTPRPAPGKFDPKVAAPLSPRPPASTKDANTAVFLLKIDYPSSA